jgi:ParB/RepB/Spo0J family partition protein
MKKYPYYDDLPIEQIAADPDQPRRDIEVNEGSRLQLSIEEIGVEEPLKVNEVEPGRYIIIDGHRRYECCKRLGMKTVPCKIYLNLDPVELETRRFNMQNNRQPWKPLERSGALERIKNYKKFTSNHQLAAYLHLGKSMVSRSLILRTQNLNYLTMMEKYDLNTSYRDEFVTLYPKLRKVRDFKVSTIIKIVFEKIQHKIKIRAKDLRILGKIFLRASANEEEICEFLSNPDMTIKELERNIQQQGISVHIEEALKEIALKVQEGIAFTTQERNVLLELSQLLKQALSRHAVAE